MRVRIFTGERWARATVHGDYEFDVLPQAGHKLTIAGPSGWESGVVRDVAHRLTDPGEAADVALLVSPLVAGSDADAALPVADLDRLQTETGAATTVAAPAKPPLVRPWDRS